MLHPLEHLLRWHNYTLRSVDWIPEARPETLASIRELLDRNSTIREAAAALAERKYRVLPPALWPIAMHKMGTMPSLVYLMLRRGNVDEFASTRCLPRGLAGGSKDTDEDEPVPSKSSTCIPSSTDNTTRAVTTDSQREPPPRPVKFYLYPPGLDIQP
jgi:hypothetical protein